MTKTGRLLKKPRTSFRVSDHAMERFRERVREDTAHRSHDDLADLLNERIRSSARKVETTDPRCPGQPTTLYAVGSQSESEYVAVVRDETVVTILDDWMAQRNFEDWKPVLAASPFAALANMKLEPPPPDPYLELAKECRELGKKVAALRVRDRALAEEHAACQRELLEAENTLHDKQKELLARITPE